MATQPQLTTLTIPEPLRPGPPPTLRPDPRAHADSVMRQERDKCIQHVTQTQEKRNGNPN